tara:strand:+ start:57017 stop:57598 length:582 start_codon:yes stop_codon:yes gene_type:complete
MMKGFEAFQYATAVNLHFNSAEYDAFKYHFKTKVTQESYWKRNDKYQLTKIGNRFKTKDEIIKYFAAHQVAGNKWVGDMLRDEKTYTDFLKRMESLSYIVKDELRELTDTNFNDLLTAHDGEYPIIINKYLEGTVSLETVCILNRITGFIEWAKQLVSETILFPDIADKVIKYQQFLEYDEKRMRNLVHNLFK